MRHNSHRLLLSLVVVCSLATLHPICAEEAVHIVEGGRRETEENGHVGDANDHTPTPMRVLNEKIVPFTPKSALVVDDGGEPPSVGRKDHHQQEKAEDQHAARMQKAAEEELLSKKKLYHQQQIVAVEAEEHAAAAAARQVREQEAIDHSSRQQHQEETIQEPFVGATHLDDADSNFLEGGASSSSSHQEHKRPLWGGATVHDEQQENANNSHDEHQEKQQLPHDIVHLPSIQPQPQQKGFPFIPKHSSVASSSSSGLPTSSLHSPPKGYVITARVYIDPADKLAHLDQNHITLPYWDCGVTGSTTSPLAIKEATFRHSLSPSTPSSWSGTDGKHALLAVALSPLILDVSSGESLTIQPGQVVLLEDVLVAGHKFRPINHLQDLQVLFLTLPQPHYHTGKEHVSLHASSAKSQAEHPCPIIESGDELTGAGSGVATSSLSSKGKLSVFNGMRARRWLFGLVGMSLSTLVADFLGKTAPLWLAAGIGGTCFVVAGTALSVFLGETLCINLEAWYQQRRLRATRSSPASPSAASEPTLEKQQHEE